MARTPLLLGTLVALGAHLAAPAAPVDAQEDFTWTTDRPDGTAPVGIVGDRVLPEGMWEFRPAFHSFDFEGTRLGSQFISFAQLLDFFEFAPFEMTAQSVIFNLAYGASDEVTLLGRFGWSDIDRTQIDANDNIFSLESSGVTDTEVHVLWEVFRDAGWRAHLQGGVSLPTGSEDEEDGAPGLRADGILPYDMQIGTGVFGFIPGATVQAMNEHGSVGLQVTGRIYVDENDRGWRPGNAVEANGWAAYRFNDFFSVSSGLRAQAWEPIVGFDAALDPERDPGELPTSFGGERVDIPLGVNLRLPAGPLAGHRLGVEFMFNVHEDLDGVWLAADQGFVVSWRATF